MTSNRETRVRLRNVLTDPDTPAVTPAAADRIPIYDADGDLLGYMLYSAIDTCGIQTLTLPPGATTFAPTERTVLLSGT